MKRSELTRIDPVSRLGGKLLGVEKPARYLGGEYGSIRKKGDGLLSIALCFPDLYEIGMSNNAIRILYSGLNSMPDVRAERVFAPAPDFEELLAREAIPLYTLETGIALSDVDILGFSLGYELAATSIFAVLKSGCIHLRAKDRLENEPIVIAGGPAATNPHPFASFFDAVFIGEAEAGFYELSQELAVMKASGRSRADILARLSLSEAIWMPSGEGRAGKGAKRAVFAGFPATPAFTAFPIPSVKAVQDHGTVEIMRGCPNGCRFCHAGYFYRPQRAKPYDVIRSEVESLVTRGGYREITLSSLSSGDYPGIGSLLDTLNAEWGARRISFQLPSLKISSFTLPIVRKLAEVRKSGLTFAVETPVDEWQKSINKDVSFEKTVAILTEAKAAGFKQAKFYFMIGLPLPGRGLGEAQAIVGFFERLAQRIQLQINVNVGTFVPKPHTPYQCSAQLSETEALEAINCLRSGLKRFKNIKLSYHSPFVSQLEGIIARGDERVGELLLSAFEKGARLDAWEEKFDRELWRSVIEGADWPVVTEICGEHDVEAPLPWDDISIRVSRKTLLRELDRSIKQELTSACEENCTGPCGVCGDKLGIVKKTTQAEADPAPAAESVPPALPRRPNGRIVFRYSKHGNAAYLQHLAIIDAFERAFLMSGMDIAYSEGFNPMPRLETAQPISIAIESECEIGSILICSDIDGQAFTDTLNRLLPDGLRVEEAHYYPLYEGKKQRTIGSLEWGSLYEIRCPSSDAADRLTMALEGRLKERSVPEYRLHHDRGSPAIRLRLRLPSNKDHGLLRLLEASTEERPIQGALHLKRLELLSTVDCCEPQSFFKSYAESD
jgi:radical SAM family uncharacterized protein/radical SAM-linked protein